MAIEVKWGSTTHVGCVRSVNQDATLAGPSLFVVADGMGGHAAGEVASTLAVARIAGSAMRLPLEVDDVLDAVSAANSDIMEVAIADPEKHAMGTTVAGIALVMVNGADHVLAFNAGDSRVYRWHGGTLFQVSNDHSVVGDLVREGRLSAADSRTHPSRHIVTRALGIAPDVEVDIQLFEPTVGDLYVICSDGLTNELSDRELSDAIHRGTGDPQSSADALLELALDRGARDNVSVILVELIAVHAGEAMEDENTNPKLLIAVPESHESGTTQVPPNGAGVPEEGEVILGVPSFITTGGDLAH